MMRELIINGQHVDIAPDIDITLEYVSNILGDVGKISLSHSYTVKLPKTLRNAMVLDDPGNLGHESGATRRFLSARYYKNGIDLIGEAQAYILKVTPESYELALVWNTLDALQALSQSDATLNDLQDLPVLSWVGPDGQTPDYFGSNDTGGALFARYNSGLGGTTYPTVNTLPHPSIMASTLLRLILTQAGVNYQLTAKAMRDLSNLVVLAAPGHAPTREMEIESGSVPTWVKLEAEEYSTGGPYELITRLNMKNFQNGWDSTSAASSPNLLNSSFNTGSNESHKILINIQAPASVDLSDSAICVDGYNDDSNMVTSRAELFREYFKRNDAGWYVYAYEEIKLSGWEKYSFKIKSDKVVTTDLTAYDPALPRIAAHRVHEAIDVAHDNRFPIAGNLPDIKQWGFLSACCAMLGWVPIVQSNVLHLVPYEEIISTERAYDWTAKVDMSTGWQPDTSFTLGKWSRINTLGYKADAPLNFDATTELNIQDTTLSESRKYYELPFAASMQNNAIHYTIKDGKAEDVNMQPRIFRLTVNEDAEQALTFTEDMYGEGLKAAHYAKVQEIIRKPVTIVVNIRLHEIDLAQLDMTRPVYLGQYGHYYLIQKIQTSDTDLCKVELLQIV